PPPPPSTLFPYTTLFRSDVRLANALDAGPHFLARHENPVAVEDLLDQVVVLLDRLGHRQVAVLRRADALPVGQRVQPEKLHVGLDRKSTRLNSSHGSISY